MNGIAEFFQTPEAVKVMENMLPDPVKREQVIRIQTLISGGELDEANRLTAELDENTRADCFVVAAAILLGIALADLMQD